MLSHLRTLFLISLFLPVVASAQEPDSTLLAGPLAVIDSLIDAGDYAEVESRARQLLAETDVQYGSESLETAEVLDRLVESMWVGGKADNPEAEQFADRALAIKRETLGADHPAMVRSLNNRAAIHWILCEYQAARSLYEIALPIAEKAGGPEALRVAKLLNSLSMLNWTLGEYEKARSLQERALAIWEDTYGPDHPTVARSLSDLAVILDALGDFQTARRLHERALAIRENVLGPNHPDVEGSLVNLGNLLQKMGHYEEARPIYERALAINERAFGADHLNIAACLNNLAILLMELGDYQEARSLHERALAIREENLGPDHPDVAGSLDNLAVVLKYLGEEEMAIPLHERALAMKEEVFGPESPEVARTLNNLATLLTEVEDYQQACQLYERARGIWQKSMGPEHPDVAACLNNLATAQCGLRDYERARALYERTIAIWEKTVGPDHPDLAQPLASLASLLAMEGETGDALALCLRAAKIARQHLRLTGGWLSEREALGYASVSLGSRDLALTISNDASEPAWQSRIWDAVIRSRALVLDEMFRRHRSSNESEDPEISALSDELNTARTRFAQLVARGPQGQVTETYRTQIDEARREKERAERALAARNAGFQSQLESDQVGFAEVREVLPPQSALVAFSRYEDGPQTEQNTTPCYHAFVLTGGDEDPVAIHLGQASTIDSLIGLWKEEAAQGMADVGVPAWKDRHYRVAGEALRRRIWDLVVGHLDDQKRVFVVPDGAINLVSFASLPVGEDTYLAESDLRIHYLSSERDLVQGRETRSSGEGLLALGDPEFDQSASPLALTGLGETSLHTLASGQVFRGRRSRRSDFESLRFTPLPETGREVDDLASIWGMTAKDLCLKGRQASEAAMKACAPGKRVLHLATHGFFLGEDHGEGQYIDNPLLLSGLALAGANRRNEVGLDQEDGIVTAEEVAALDLAGVEWAVLSACETGIGQVKTGEGVLGLRRAFQVAGVRTLIMSLWEVDDRATREWMQALYKARFGDGLETIEAVREASLRVLQARRQAGESTHPFFWGAFIASGQWK